MRQDYRGGNRFDPETGQLTPDVRHGWRYGLFPGTFKAHPGSAMAGGAAGATGGYMGADEDATTVQKLLRAGKYGAAGTLAGPIVMRGLRESLGRAVNLGRKLPSEIRHGLWGGLEGFGLGGGAEVGARAVGDVHVDPKWKWLAAGTGAALRAAGRTKAQAGSALRKFVEPFSQLATGPKGGGGAGAPLLGRTWGEAGSRFAATGAIPLAAQQYNYWGTDRPQRQLMTAVADPAFGPGEVDEKMQAFLTEPDHRVRRQIVRETLQTKLGDLDALTPDLHKAPIEVLDAAHAKVEAAAMLDAGFTKEQVANKNSVELRRVVADATAAAGKAAVAKAQQAKGDVPLTPEEKKKIVDAAVSPQVAALGATEHAQKKALGVSKRLIKKVMTNPETAKKVIALQDKADQLAAAEKNAFSMGKTIDGAVDWFDEATKDVFDAVGLGDMSKWHKILLAGGLLVLGMGGMGGSGLMMAAGGLAMLGAGAAHAFPDIFNPAPVTGTAKFKPSAMAESYAKSLSDADIQKALVQAGKLAPIPKPTNASVPVGFAWDYLAQKGPALQHLLSAIPDSKTRTGMFWALKKELGQPGMLTKDESLTPAGMRRILAMAPPAAVQKVLGNTIPLMPPEAAAGIGVGGAGTIGSAREAGSAALRWLSEWNKPGPKPTVAAGT
jgi:hypothetical protein